MEMLSRDEWPSLFPDRAEGPREEIERRMGGLRFTEAADERHHFSLLAPLGMRRGETGSRPGLLVSLVRGAPPVAEVAVFVDDVPREVSPAEWTLHRLERDGHALWARREADTPIGTMADLLTRRKGLSGEVVARTNMAKDGRRVFTVTCEASVEQYPRLAGDFYVTLASFTLLHPERAPLAERLASYCYLHPAVVGFSYPASWTVEEEVLSQARCDVRLDASRGDARAGRLHVFAHEGGRSRRMVAELFERMKQDGVQVDERPDLAPCDPPKDASEASSLAARGVRDGREVEVRAFTFTTSKATVLLASCGPARADSPFDWMVLKRAFEIVRETIYAV